MFKEHNIRTLIHTGLNMGVARGKAGFTLIELMVVVAIIGILMAAGILAFSNAQRNARDARRRADVDAISKALEQYYQNNNYVYPATAGAVATYFPSGAAPLDPQGSSYNFNLNTARYCICATLEATGGKGNATAVGTPGTGICTFGTGASANFFCAASRQ